MGYQNVILDDARKDPEKTICKAARNDYSRLPTSQESFAERMESIEGETLDDKKGKLIGDLLRHGHFGPFEHASATFSIEGVSRSLMAQLTRHRHATYDIQSMRYVPFADFDTKTQDTEELVVHPPSASDPEWIGRNQSTGAVDEETAKRREEVFHRSVEGSVNEYQELLDLGMPPEDARFVLPIGTRTNIMMTLNVRQLMHIADMRAAADSQWEIRQMTEEILDLAAEWCPYTFEYYDEHMKDRKNRLAP